MTESLTYESSVHVAADPKQVYAVVSDITRTGEWSPVCRECWWDEGDGPRVGAFFTGRNVTPNRTWETHCEIVAATEAKEFGWAVNGGRVIWRYRMEPADGGTTLTESWEFTPIGQTYYAERYGDDAPNQIAARAESISDNIGPSLAALKRVIEAG